MSDATNPVGSGPEAAEDTGSIIRERVAEMPDAHDAQPDDEEQPVSLVDTPEPDDSDDEPEPEGEDTPNEDEEASPAPEPERYTVKIDGKDVEVTPEELKEWRDSGLRQADYTRKTQEIAEIRRAAEARQNQYEQALQQVVGQLQQDPILNRKKEDWEALKASDPIQYALDWADAQQKHAEMHQHQTRLQQEQQARLQERLQEQAGKLVELVPEWGDEAKRKAVRDEIVSYGKSIGIDEREFDNITDARHVRILRDAAKYQALMAKRDEASKKAAKAPPVQKPNGAAKTGRSSVDPSKMSMTEYAKWRGYAK